MAMADSTGGKTLSPRGLYFLRRLGYQVVNGMNLLTELVEKASKKEIIIK